MSQYNEYDQEAVEAAYYEDPIAFTSALASAAASQAAAEAAQFTSGANSAVVASQAALVSDHIESEMRARYGESYDQHRDDVVQAFISNPNLLPQNEGILDPAQMRQSFSDAYKLALGNRAERDRTERWSAIQNAPSNKLNL